MTFRLLQYATLSVCLLFNGCGEEASIPHPGDPEVREHLLGIIDRMNRAGYDLDKATLDSLRLPEIVYARRKQAQLLGRDPDSKPSPEMVKWIRSQGPMFSGDAPISVDMHANWVRLEQKVADDDGDGVKWHIAYFLHRDKRWWCVERAISGSAPQAGPVSVAFADAMSYWPDHIEDYFFLPEVELVGEWAGPESNGRRPLSLSVANRSDQTISSHAMRRWFTSINCVVGDMTYSVGNTEPTAFGPLKPGQSRNLGVHAVRVSNESEDRLIMYVNQYAVTIHGDQ